MRVLPDPTPQHPKLVLHDAVQAAFRNEQIAPGLGTAATLTRWAVIGELVLPRDQRSFVTMTSTIDGSELHSWEAYGFYLKALQRAMRSGA